MVRTESHERHHDATLGLDDLEYMTRENQILHGELLDIRRQNEQLSAKAKEHEDLALPREQYFKGAEMQRENVLRAYQQVLDERRRNEVAATELSGQGDRTEAAAKALCDRLAAVQHGEKAARARMRQGGAELLSLRARLSDATRKLETCTLACSQAQASKAQTMQAAGTRQAAISEAVVNDAEMAAQVQALQNDVERSQQELQSAQASVADNRRELDAVRWQQTHMQGLLAQQRQSQQQLEAESALLRGLLAGAGAETSPGPGRATTASHGCHESSAVTGLQRTLGQQGTLLSEMAGERRRLAEQLERLREELASTEADRR